MNDVIELYDSLGGEYLSSMYTANSWTNWVDKKEKKVVHETFKLDTKDIINKEKILDLGMGPGRWSKFFLKQGFNRVYGIDIAPKMVEYAKKDIHSNKFEAKVANMQKLPFEGNFFNKVFCFRSFKYVNNPKIALREIKRVLKPDGTLLLELSNKSLFNILLLYIAKLIVKIRPTLHLQNRWRYYLRARFYTKNEIASLVSNLGFKVQTVKPLFALPSVPLPSGKITVSGWIVLDRALFHILPKNWFARSWVFLLKK